METMSEIALSTLPKTWIFDLDGTLVKHNGYKLDGEDTLLPGAAEYLASIPREDKIVIFTARESQFREQTLDFLERHGIRFDEIFFDMPLGERILVNDRKPSGLEMSIAFNLERDSFSLPAVLRIK